MAITGRRIGGAHASIAAALAALLATAASASPGALTSAAELAKIRAAADAGQSPHAQNREMLLRDAREAWAWGSVSGKYVTGGTTTSKTCHPASNADAIDYLVEGAPDAYAQALGAHLAGDTALAQQARAHVLDLVDTYGFHGLAGDYGGTNQCVLDLAVSVPVWIETARLLEDTSTWSASDTSAFRSWLASHVYPKVAWASRVRRNNWGTAGSLAAYSIALYVDGAVSQLEEYSPTRRTLAPSQAAAAHVGMQLLRIATSWAGDTQCSKRGIQSHGGIPDELRRGKTGCDGSYLVDADNSLAYQTMHAELLVFHAEAMRRQGDPGLYGAKTSTGDAAILQSILFVIANPAGGTSWPWHKARWGALITAATFYDHANLTSAAKADSSFRGGRTLPYTRVTRRPFAADGGTAPPTQVGAPGKPVLVDG